MARGSLWRTALPAAGLLVLLAGWLYLYVHSHNVDTQRQNQTLALLKDLKQLDAQWDANVLRSHADINPNYDALVRPLAQFDDSLAQLRMRAVQIHPQGLADSVAALGRAVDAKAALIDAFKAQNSLFKNSLRYVPTAHKDIRSQFLGVSRLADLDRELGLLVNEALVYSASPSADVAESLRAGIGRLRSVSAVQPPAVRAPVSNLLSHMDTLLNLRARQSDVLRAISQVPVADGIDALAAGFTRHFNAELDRQFGNQQLLLAYGGLSLLLVAGGSGFIWYRTATEQRRLRALVEEKTRELNVLATRDDLSRVHNRRHTAELLTQLLAQHARSGAPICLAVLDIDLFKAINDRCGHAAGDAVLLRFATIARRTLRTVDVLGRWGGEEFLAGLPQTTIDQAEMALQRVREALAQADFTDIDSELRVTFSAGLVVLGTGELASRADALSKAVERADLAMYRAKTLGRDRIELG